VLHPKVQTIWEIYIFYEYICDYGTQEV